MLLQTAGVRVSMESSHRRWRALQPGEKRKQEGVPRVSLEMFDEVVMVYAVMATWGQLSTNLTM